MHKAYISNFAWGLSSFVTLLAILTWGQSFDWQFSFFSSYLLFPLFGLIAFSLMWAHYIVACVRKYSGASKDSTNKYFEVTSFIVLFTIIAHPGLLIWQLWRDGFGLPPNSYYEFVGPSMKLAVSLGSVSLLIFLAYELRRKFGKKTWWKFVQYASDAAMLAIFVHGLKLGHNLQSGWYSYVWYFYGITLIGSLIYLYAIKSPNKKSLT